MRGKKTLINVIMGLIEEIVTVICGFILPRLILATFGSKYNGLTSSITQFLSCAVLFRAGIGGVTRAALYKPLATNNIKEISAIIKTTDKFMKKVGFILIISILILASLYPIFIKNEFDWFFTFSLFIIIGASTVAESFFGITYSNLLQADQKVWVTSFIKTICYILNTIIGSVLILNGFGIHFVKLASATIFVIYPIVQSIYVKNKYKIDMTVEADYTVISQRWDSFWHQVATFVMGNTDIIVLTIFSNMLEVSVYTIYNMILRSLKNVITKFSNGLEGAFGDIIAKDENDKLKQNFSIIEFFMYNISTFVYTCTCILIFQFIKIYTNGVNDINYIRPWFAYILILSQFFNCVRIPYQTVVQAAGHYKQTKKGAIIEPIINILLSVILVIKFGLVGVAVGTLVATIYRTIQYSTYMSNNIIKRKKTITFYKCIISFIECIIIILIVRVLNFNESISYFNWGINAIYTSIISAFVIMIGSLIFYKDDFKIFVFKLKKIIKKK